MIEADVPNVALELQAGLFAEAELVVNPTAQAISVPSSAISRFAGVEKVWIIVDGIAKQQTVQTGREERGRVEIVDGLSAGSLLVRNSGDGHDGPVVAIEAPQDKPLQAELPETSSTAQSKSTVGGAQ